MGAEEACRDNSQSTKREQEADRQLLKARELKFLDLDDRQDQDANIYQDVCKDSAKEEVCTFDRTYKVFDSWIPEGMYGIAMEGGKEDLEEICKSGLDLGDNHNDLHE